MRFEFKPSFGRGLKRFPPIERERIKLTSDRLIRFYTSGERTPGLGITHLRGEFWEGRSGLRARVLYRWRRDLVEFVLAGDHEDVKRFLRHSA